LTHSWIATTTRRWTCWTTSSAAAYASSSPCPTTPAALNRWRRYRSAQARIYGHPAVATRLGDVSGFEAVTCGGDVAGIARFHSLGKPPRSQQPIEIAAVRALVFGDAVVETGGGELRVWATPLDSAHRRRSWHTRYLPTLQRLVNLDIDHVLVTHGEPAIGDGKTALQRALESAPWQRPKRAARRTSLQRE